FIFFFTSRRRHTRCLSDWSSDVCSSDLVTQPVTSTEPRAVLRDHVPVATRPATGRPTVVIVGAGFGGLRAARALRKAPVNVVLRSEERRVGISGGTGSCMARV